MLAIKLFSEKNVCETYINFIEITILIKFLKHEVNYEITFLVQ